MEICAVSNFLVGILIPMLAMLGAMHGWYCQLHCSEHGTIELRLLPIKSVHVIWLFKSKNNGLNYIIIYVDFFITSVT